MTLLYYTFFDQCIPEHNFNKLLRLLPDEQSEKIKKFRKWQDAHASLFGKLILQSGFREFGLSITMKDVKLNSHGKPYIEKCPLAFNISHSGNCVVCVISADTQSIGIDVEEIKAIDIRDFRNIFSEQEWNKINNRDPKIFYQYWTKKEATIKAEGSGLSIPLNQIEIEETYARFENKMYSLQEIHLRSDFVTHIASIDKIGQIRATIFDIVEFENSFL